MLNFSFLGASSIDWFWAIIDVVVAFLLAKLFLWSLSSILTRFSKISPDKIRGVIEHGGVPISLLIVLIGIRLALTHFPISSDYLVYVSKIYVILATLDITWILSSFVTTLVSEFLTQKAERKDSSINPTAIPTIKHSIQVVIWGIGIVLALTNSGYDVGALIAGLGIGGVAVALAAKDTVTNFFGGFTIIIDKPFRIGDRVRVSGFDGYVTTIGLRTFRLSTLDGTEVIIPNTAIIDSVVENVTREPARRIITDLGLTYDTTPQQMHQAIEILRQIVKDNKHLDKKCNVFFSSYGDFSLNIKLIYYIKKSSDILESQSEVNLAILEQFNAAGLNFAYPTQSLYIEEVKGKVSIGSNNTK